MAPSNFQPYCGSPPVPGGLHWNLDPVLIAVFAAVVGVYAAWVSRRKIEVDDRQMLAGGAGLVVLAASLIAPLCNLSIALFAARAGQHVLMLLIAAPLLVLGLPRGRVGAFEAIAWPLGFA